MPNEVKIELTASETGFVRALRAGESAANTFGQGIKNAFSHAQRGIDAANKTFGTFGKVAAALGSGVVLKKIFSLDEFMAVDDALLMMQANLHKSGKELDGFKQKLAAMAGAEGENQAALFRQAGKLSKSWDENDILKILEASSRAADAMEQDLDSVSARVVQIMKMYRKTPDEAKAIADAMTASNADAGTLDTLLQRGIMKGGAGKSYQEVLAIAGGLRKLGAESPRVVGAIEAMMNAIEDKPGLLKRAGIKTAGKDIIGIMEQLGPALEKEKKKLGEEKFNEALDKAFGGGAHEALPFLLSNLDKIKAAKEEQTRAGEIAAARLAKAGKKWSEQFEKIKGNLAAIKTDLSWIYDLAKKPVKFLADSPALTKGLGYGAAAASLGVLGYMGKGKIGEFVKNYKGTAGGLIEGAAIESLTGVKSVFVVNWPKSFGGILPDGTNNPGLGTRMIDLAKKAGTSVATVGGISAGVLGSIITVEALAAAAMQRAGAGEAAGLRKWRTDNPYDYDRSKEVMGGQPVNHITIKSISIDQARGRVTTEMEGANTTIDIPRGDLK